MIRRDEKKRSYGAEPVASEDMYGVFGHPNRFGGFHHSTDTYAYIGSFKLLLTLLIKGQIKNAKWVWKQTWRLWIHRRCDTTDFHHSIYCTLDPWVRKRDAQDDANERWHEVWTT